MEGSPHSVETQLRLMELQRQLLAGTPLPEVRAFICATWGLQARQARRLISAAQDEIREDFEEVGRHQLIATLLARLDRIAQQAEKDRNWNAAVGALRTQARICGLTSN